MWTSAFQKIKSWTSLFRRSPPTPLSIEIESLKTKLLEVKAILRGSIENESEGQQPKMSRTAPWFLMLGSEDSGKSTLIQSSGILLPIGSWKEELDSCWKGNDSVQTPYRASLRSDSRFRGNDSGGGRNGNERKNDNTDENDKTPQNIDYLFSQNTIFLDTAGRYISAPAAHKAWRVLLSLLKQHRRHHPIQGILLIENLADLLTQSETKMALHVQQLRDRLHEMMKILGTRFPLFLILTHSDQLKGFHAFFSTLSPTEREQAFGMVMMPNSDFREQAATLESRLYSLILHQLKYEHDPQIQQDLYHFPEQCHRAFQKIEKFLSQLGKNHPYQKTPRIVGIYLTSAVQNDSRKEGTTPSGFACHPSKGGEYKKEDSCLRRNDSREGNDNIKQCTDAQFGRLYREHDSIDKNDNAIGYFIKEVLEKRIRYDPALKQTSLRPWHVLIHLPWSWVSLGLGMIIFGWLSFSQAFQSNVSWLDRGLHAIEYQENQNEVSQQKTLFAWTKVYHLLEHPSSLLPWYERLGLYRGNQLLPPLGDVISLAWQNYFLSKTALFFEKQLDSRFRHPPEMAESYALLKAYLTLCYPSHIDLSESPYLFSFYWPQKEELDSRWKSNDSVQTPYRASLRSDSRFRGNDSGGGRNGNERKNDNTESTTPPPSGAPLLWRGIKWSGNDKKRGNAELFSIYLARLSQYPNTLKGIVPWQVNAELVEAVRQKLRSQELAPELFREVEIRFTEKLSQVALRDFLSANEAKNFESHYPVSQFYHPRIWKKRVNPELQRLSKKLKKGDWVLYGELNEFGEGKTSKTDYLTVDPNELLKNMTELYQNRASEKWRMFLSSLRIKPFSSLKQAGLQLHQFSRFEGPLFKLIQKIQQATPTPHRGWSPESRRRYREGLESLADFVQSLEQQSEDDASIQKLVLQTFDHPEIDSPLYQAYLSVNESLKTLTDAPLRQDLEPLLMSPIQETWRLLVNRSLQQVEKAWQKNVMNFYRVKLEHRFPLFPSKQLINSNDLIQFFQPEVGCIGRFWNIHLSPWIIQENGKFQTKSWLGIGGHFSKAWLNELSHALKLTNLFFAADKNLPHISFEIYPLPTPGLSQIILQIGNQIFRYSNGPQSWRTLTLPLASNDFDVRLTGITASGRTMDSHEFHGVWAVIQWLREAKVAYKGKGTYQCTWLFPNSPSIAMLIRSFPFELFEQPFKLRDRL